MHSPLPCEFPYIYTDSEDQPAEWIVTFAYTPPLPGVYNALPENCYPDEPEEIEITKIISSSTGREVDETTLSEDLRDEIEAAAYIWLESQSDWAEPEDYSLNH